MEGAGILVASPVMRTWQVSGGQLGSGLEQVREKLRKHVAGRNDVADATPGFRKRDLPNGKGPRALSARAFVQRHVDGRHKCLVHLGTFLKP